jgi:hypothetical protein
MKSEEFGGVGGLHRLHGVSKSYGEVFFELPVGRGGSIHSVIETWIYKEVGGDIAVELEYEGVLPLEEEITVRGVGIETCLPLEIVERFPYDFGIDERAYIVAYVFAFVKSETGSEV